jgi:hypothetical protein
MADFSAGEAIGAGFGIIKRRPKAILAWAAAYFVGGILPQGLIWSQLAPLMQVGHTPDPAALAARMSSLGGLAPLFWILGLVMSSVMYGAAFRAVLQPDDDRFLYLRLSVQELWLGLTMLALMVVFGIGCAIVAFVIGLLSGSLPGIVTFLLAVAAIVALGWLAMRFSVAPVMAFAERRFVFGDIWPVTAGHSLKLFGVAVAIVAILIGLEFAFGLPVLAVLSASGALNAMSSSGTPVSFSQLLPWMVLGGVVASLFGAVVIAVAGAPWASIYRQLTGGGASA